MELRDYQLRAVASMADCRRGICVAPAGSGKTIVAAALVEKLSCPELFQPSVVWLVHTKEQKEQAIVATSIHVKADAYARFNYFCYASMPDLSQADIVIVDECHWGGCDMLQSILRTARPDARVYGFTATPKREDGIDITGIIGPILYTVERETLTKTGAVLKGVVRVVAHGVEDSLKDLAEARALEFYKPNLRWHDKKTGTEDQWNRLLFQAVLHYGIRNNPERDAVIARLALSHAADSVIVLVDSKEHGRKLVGMIPGSVILHSGVAGRAAKVEAFQSGEIRCVVATSLADEGLDVPRANVMILAGSGKAFGKVIQRTGRVLRPFEGKERGLIYDFFDKGHGMLRTQHWQRKRHCRKAGYSVEWWRDAG